MQVAAYDLNAMQRLHTRHVWGGRGGGGGAACAAVFRFGVDAAGLGLGFTCMMMPLVSSFARRATAAGGRRHYEHVTRHTSHVTRYTSQVTRHTSHVTRYTSHVTAHACDGGVLLGDPPHALDDVEKSG